MILRSIVLSVLLVASATAAADLTAEQAMTLVVQKPWTPKPPPKPEELAAARKALEAAAAREPASARWAYGLAHLAAQEARQAGQEDVGDDKRDEAVELFTKACERDPKSADCQFWLADANFERIDDVNMLTKMSLASAGKKAYERAVQIDPHHVGAHVGLGQYYLQAPGIAGGSLEKAKAEGTALLAIPGGRGAFLGNMLLASIAAKGSDWAEMSRRYTAAETCGGDGSEPLSAMRQHAWLLLHDKKDPKAAQPVMERYMKLGPPNDLTALFLDGEIKRQLGRCADALPLYQQVLAKHPAALNSRWGSALCNEAVGDKSAARRDYEEFIKRFPKDDKTPEAKAALKRLSG